MLRYRVMVVPETKKKNYEKTEIATRKAATPTAIKRIVRSLHFDRCAPDYSLKFLTIQTTINL
jgi:hypothetical protein